MSTGHVRHVGHRVPSTRCVTVAAGRHVHSSPLSWSATGRRRTVVCAAPVEATGGKVYVTTPRAKNMKAVTLFAAAVRATEVGCAKGYDRVKVTVMKGVFGFTYNVDCSELPALREALQMYAHLARCTRGMGGTS